MTPEEKEKKLLQWLSAHPSALVAFSGGVDSSYLAYLAHRALGEKALAVTAVSPSVSELQKGLAEDFARRYGLNHRIVFTREMENPDYTSNPSNRCYFCKSELYDFLGRLRREWSVAVVLDGSNSDDVGDYRPGRRAAEEREVVSPLIDFGLTKDEIRLLSKRAGLPTWDQPAMPCLSSRFPYGVAITEEKLRQVDRAEAVLRRRGLRNFRVRHHESLARIEVAREEMEKVLDPRVFEEIDGELRDLGYRHVTLDLRGFRSGSLNEALTQLT